jgi:NAD(P)-dependent dehydrogenase (short-subunit alcohol dehydrogenase family)
MRLTGKTAIITGGASGIGLASARLFASHGAKVAIVDRAADRLEAALLALRGAGLEAVGALADVCQAAACRRAAEEILGAFGRIDILFNNAGVLVAGTVLELSEDDWWQSLGTNLGGVFHMSRAVLPHMLRQGGGTILNMASTAGLVAEPGIAAYAAAKGAVVQLTKAMALDLARRNIRVNCLCPGWVDTPFNDPVLATLGGRGELLRAIDQFVPQGRQAEPVEIARAALFLVSDEASYVTGHAFVVDGGLMAQ